MGVRLSVAIESAEFGHAYDDYVSPLISTNRLTVMHLKLTTVVRRTRKRPCCGKATAMENKLMHNRGG